jgi:DNA modification methylase
VSSRIIHGKCVEAMAAMSEASVDAIVTDPPYLISFMGKAFDSQHRADASGASEGEAMQEWHETWAREALRVLKPGGHLLAFGGTRTYHRLACAIEDAGFEIRDTIAWLYGSGFPKSLDVSKAIDKRPGVARHAEFAAHLRERIATAGFTNTFDVAERVIGRRTGAVANWQKYQWPEAKWWPALRDLLDLDPAWGPVIAEAEREKTGERGGNLLAVAPGQGEDRSATTLDVTAPATPEAEQWAGWGTALKPAHEPIVVARKPLTGTVSANILAHGTGALNVDGCRIGASVDDPNARANKSHKNRGTHGYSGPWEPMQRQWDGAAGRWPANVVLDETAAAMLDAQTGTLTSGSGQLNRNADKFRNAYGAFQGGDESADVLYGDSGGASRFLYVAKSSTVERSAGLDSKICSCHEHDEKKAPPPLKATGEDIATVGYSSSTSTSGSKPTGPCRTDSKSTTSTGIGPTTTSRTSNCSPPPTTSAPTPPTSAATMLGSGCAAAPSAPSGSQPPPSTTTSAAKAGSSTDDADPATSRGSSPTSSSAVCADCGGVVGGAVRNTHPLEPTVKPIALMRWLVRLVTPPGGTVLDCFAGSGTTGIAAALERFDFIGIEREAEYAAIAEARIAWWARHPDGMTLVARLDAERERAAVVDAGQAALFEVA